MYIEVIDLKRCFMLLAAFFLAINLAGPVSASSFQAGKVQINSGRLNIRSSPSVSGAVITKLEKDNYVTLLAKSGQWWQVEYTKGQTGYCHSDYISILSGKPARVRLTSGTLNVRTGAGVSYGIQASLRDADNVIILSDHSGWSKILYHGSRIGFVSTKYLSQDSNTSFVLQIPSFKQTDSRWAKTYIGSSGKTMAEIGCATTAIAMMESFRTGSLIYPDAMARRLRYTSSGSVYWPAHYRTVTSSADYLLGIRSRLNEGKPVLFGSKNQLGGQHWVVVSGYSGNGTDPSHFSILDPGSNSRMTLRQFLSDYPNFYKYFYY